MIEYDLTNIDNFEDKCYVPSSEEGFWLLNPETETAIFLLHAIGISEITEDNLQDVIFRAVVSQALGNRGHRGQHFYTQEDIVRIVESHVGLKTNTHDETEEQFIENEMKSIKLDIAYNALAKEVEVG